MNYFLPEQERLVFVKAVSVQAVFLPEGLGSGNRPYEGKATHIPAVSYFLLCKPIAHFAVFLILLVFFLMK